MAFRRFGLSNPGNMLLALKVSVLVMAVLALYFQDLNVVFRDALGDESTSYVFLVPLLLIYLVYRKRKVLGAAIFSRSKNEASFVTRFFSVLSGIVLCTLAVILYWYGSNTFTPLQNHVLTLPFYAAGVTLILFNLPTLRELAFPIGFLIFLAPLPSQVTYGLGSTLSVASSEASNAIVKVFGIPSSISAQFGTPSITIIRPDSSILTFNVDVACSGVYSLIVFMVFGVFIAYLVRDKMWKKAGIFAAGLPLIFLLNIFRITTILIVGYHSGEQLALEVFHAFGGWILIFLGTLLLLIFTEKLFRLPLFEKKQPAPDHVHRTRELPVPKGAFCSTCGKLVNYSERKIKRSDAVKLVALALTSLLLVSIQTPVFAFARDPTQPLIQTAEGQTGNPEILPKLPGYSLRFVYRDMQFEKVSGQDLSMLYVYSPSDQEKRTVWMALEIAQTTGPLHQWESCLITWPASQGYQPVIVQLDLRDVQIHDNPPIIARYFAFRNLGNNQTQVVLYWFETSVFVINNASQQMHAKFSLIAYPQRPEDVSSTETQLLDFAIATADYRQPIKTWSAAALALSENSVSLAAGTAIFLAALIVLQVYERRRQRMANSEVYRKLPTSDRQIIDMTFEGGKGMLPTFETIAEIYKRRTGEDVEKEVLLQKLSEIERTGMVESRIVNLNDQPIYTWKAIMPRGFILK